MDREMIRLAGGGLLVAGAFGLLTAAYMPGNPEPRPNLLVNPSMRFDQVNEGTSVALSSGVAKYVVDGWQAAFDSASAAVSCQRVADGPGTTPYSLKCTVGTGATVAAGDYLKIWQPIEANQISGLGLGSASPATVCVSFQTKLSIGSYTLTAALQNAAGNRSYPVNLTVGSSGAWTPLAACFAVDSGGSWVTSGTAQGASLIVTAAAGSTYQATANAWSAGNAFGTSSTTSTILATNGATVQLANAKLEISPVATPYVDRDVAADLALAQRYFEKSYPGGVAIGTAAGAGNQRITFGAANTGPAAQFVSWGVRKRCAATLTYYDGAGTSGKVSYYDTQWRNAGSLIGAGSSEAGFFLQGGIASTYYYNTEVTGDCRL